MMLGVILYNFDAIKQNLTLFVGVEILNKNDLPQIHLFAMNYETTLKIFSSFVIFLPRKSCDCDAQLQFDLCINLAIILYAA